MAEDLLAILKADHRKVEDLFEELSDSHDTDEREQLLDEIETALERHMELEEQHVYPVVREQLGDEKEEEAQVEHELARDGLEKARAVVDQPGFLAMVAMLEAGIKHHVDEEEKEILPELKRACGREEWRELSDQVRQAHEEANRPQRTRSGAAGRSRVSGNGRRKTSAQSRSSNGRAASGRRTRAGASR